MIPIDYFEQVQYFKLQQEHDQYFKRKLDEKRNEQDQYFKRKIDEEWKDGILRMKIFVFTLGFIIGIFYFGLFLEYMGLRIFSSRPKW